MPRLRGVPSAGLDKTIQGWLDRVDLGEKVNEKCGVMSRGQQQRVQTIAALIHQPDLLILDEPFSGLDPVNRKVIADIFTEQHARGCTLILSTHMMQHAEEVCDHIVMMDRGDKVLDAPLAEVQQRTGSKTLLCEVADPSADLAPLRQLVGISDVSQHRREVRLTLQPDVEPTQMLIRVAQTVPMLRVEVERPTLEEIFIRIVEQRGGSL